MTSQRQKYEETRSYVTQSFVVALFLFGAIGFDFVGRLFLADLVVALFGVMYLIKTLSAQNAKEMAVAFGLLGITFLFVIFDTVNQIPQRDILRGVARNLSFCLSLFSGIYLARAYSLKMCVIIALASMLSPTFPELASGSYATMDLAPFVKVSGTVSILFACILLIPSMRMQVIALIVVAVVLIVVLDSRSGAAGCGAAALIAIFHQQIVKNGVKRFVVLSVIIASLLIPVTITLLSRESSTFEERSRHELSNEQRYEMAEDAFSRFLESPLIGNGSWQHAQTYTGTFMTTSFVGVHSWTLQLAFEYGVLGFAMGVVLGVHGIRSIWMLCNSAVLRPGFRRILPIALLLAVGIVYSSAFNPFAGISRITNGLVCGFFLTLIGQVNDKDRFKVNLNLNRKRVVSV